MKKIIVVLSCLFVVGIFSSSAQHWCGTEHTAEFMETLTQNVKYANNHQMRSGTLRNIPVKFHLIADNNGNGRMNEESVLLQLCRLNQLYDDLGFRFYVDGEFSYVNNSIIYNHENQAQGQMNVLKQQNSSSLNVFIPNATFSPGTAGYYTPSLDFLVVQKSSFLEPDSGTLGHEVAHLFKIAHPHTGWEDRPYRPEEYGEIVTITTIGGQQGSAQVEIMNDPNCNLTGDRICDTPPDYGFTQNGDWADDDTDGNNPSICSNPWAGFVKDRNGVEIVSMSNLVMGYNGGCDTLFFTDGQVAAMQADYIRRIGLPTSNREYMKSGYTPDTMAITEVPDLIFPANLETVDEFNGILFQWSAVANAHSYILIISDFVGNTQRIDVNETEYFVSNLNPNTPYTWKAVPINEVGYCTNNGVTAFFETGTSTSSIDEIEGLNKLAIYPNPSSKNNKLSIVTELEKSMHLMLSIVNGTGQRVLAFPTFKGDKGAHTQQIDVSALTAGIYFVQIKSDQGILTRKLLITN